MPGHRSSSQQVPQHGQKSGVVLLAVGTAVEHPCVGDTKNEKKNQGFLWRNQE